MARYGDELGALGAVGAGGSHLGRVILASQVLHWNTRFKSAHHAMDVSPIVRLDLAVRRVPRQQGGPGQRHDGTFFLNQVVFLDRFRRLFGNVNGFKPILLVCDQICKAFR